MGKIRNKLRYLCGLPFGKKHAIGVGIFDGVTTARPQDDHGFVRQKENLYYMGYGAGTLVQLGGAAAAAVYGVVYGFVTGLF